MPLTPESARKLQQAEAGDTSVLNKFVFDPITHVPATEEEVEIALKFGRPEFIARNLIGIYQCHRGMGESLLQAYKTALRTHIEAYNNQRINSDAGQAVTEQLANEHNEFCGQKQTDAASCPCQKVSAEWLKHNLEYLPQFHRLTSIRTVPPITTTNDGTAGHTKGNWYSHNRFVRVDEELDGNPTAITIAEANTSLEEYLANSKVLALAQSAPHDCGDPECPGYQNKRKLELYDKFQRAIHEFAEAGLLT